MGNPGGIFDARVLSGGIYYIISRSLGPEFGASVGIVFAFANAVAASMNTIGFCNSLNDLLRENGLKIVDGGDNDVRIIGTVAILIMIFICAVGMEWEAKVRKLTIFSAVAISFTTSLQNTIKTGPKRALGNHPGCYLGFHCRGLHRTSDGRAKGKRIQRTQR